MSNFVTAIFCPQSELPSKIRISGCLWALGSGISGFVLTRLYPGEEQLAMRFLVATPCLIMWFFSMHRAIWGGWRPTGWLKRMGHLFLSFWLCFFSLHAIGVIVYEIEDRMVGGRHATSR